MAKKKKTQTESMNYEEMSTYALWQLLKLGPETDHYESVVAEIDTRTVAENDQSEPAPLRGGIKPGHGNTH